MHEALNQMHLQNQAKLLLCLPSLLWIRVAAGRSCLLIILNFEYSTNLDSIKFFLNSISYFYFILFYSGISTVQTLCIHTDSMRSVSPVHVKLQAHATMTIIPVSC